MPNSECPMWPHSAFPLFKQPLVVATFQGPRKSLSVRGWVSSTLYNGPSLNTSSRIAEPKLPATHFWGSHLVLPWFLWDLYITAALMFHFYLHFYFLKRENEKMLVMLHHNVHLSLSMKKVFYQMEVNVKNVKMNRNETQLLLNQLKTFKIYELQTVYFHQ